MRPSFLSALGLIAAVFVVAGLVGLAIAIVAEWSVIARVPNVVAIEVVLLVIIARFLIATMRARPQR